MSTRKRPRWHYEARACSKRASIRQRRPSATGARRATRLSGKLYAHAEMPEAPGFETRRRAWRDHVAIVGPDVVDRTRKAARDGHVECGAPVPRVFHEAPSRRLRIDHRERGENPLAIRARENALVVRDQKVHCVRPMVTAAPARNAVGSVGIGQGRIPRVLVHGHSARPPTVRIEGLNHRAATFFDEAPAQAWQARFAREPQSAGSRGFVAGSRKVTR
jgi:hypothetical protein